MILSLIEFANYFGNIRIKLKLQELVYPNISRDIGHAVLRGVIMRKVTAFIAAMAAFALIFATSASSETQTEISSEASEQVILRLLFEPASDAIKNYYEEPRQYWRDKLLRVQRAPDLPYYEVVMQVETFYDPHNPPYGIETMTFYISYGKVELKEFEHQDEPQ